MKQPFLSIVPLDFADVWVVANLREDQMERVRDGNPATITLDGIPERSFQGWVESVSGGTGSVFSLFPPDNATGNFVRVVQRLPVRYRFAEPENYQNRIRPGMSAVVRIDDSRRVRRSRSDLVIGPADPGCPGRIEMQRGRGYLTALVVLATLLSRGRRASSAHRRDPRRARHRARGRAAAGPAGNAPRPSKAHRSGGPTGRASRARPIRLADALAMSLRNVETVQANISVRTATVARFEALKAFVPLVNLPTFAVGFNRLGGPAIGGTVIFPDITGGTPLVGQPGLNYAEHQSI